MKKNVLLLLVFLGVAVNATMGQTDYKQLYEHKIHIYNNMKKTGWILTGIGSGFAFAGSVMIASVPGTLWDDNSQTENIGDVFQALAGIVCLTVGVGLLAGGITLGSIGTHKVRSYTNKLNNLSLGLIFRQDKQGFSLTYRF
jgi:hypothetical protein